MGKRQLTLAVLALLSVPSIWAMEKTVEIYRLNESKSSQGIGEKLGTLVLYDSAKGLTIEPHLKGLSSGEHGFHVHEFPSCEGAEQKGKWEKGFKAGSHYDPKNTHHHLGPYQEGHLGDLPVLTVDAKGEATQKIIAPHLKLADLTDRSFVIHQNPDNYSDEPPMGGSGPRIACGVIK